MRIAVIGSKGLPPHQGGIEHHCAEIYPRMVAAGHQVDLYARSSYNQGRASHLPTVYKGVNIRTVPSIHVKGIDAFACSAMAAVLSLRGHYDIVHYHALGPSLFTPITKLFSQAKILTTCHGLDWQRAKWGAFSSWIIKAGEKNAVRYTDRVVVVAEALQSYFTQQYALSTSYIENAPVAYADSDKQFQFTRSMGLEPGRYVLFLGRLVPEKRADLLIEAFQQLQPKGWKLALVGDNSGTDGFTANLLTQAKGSEEIMFTGELQGALLAEVVRGAGLFVLPSDLEGLPLALLEAMQERIPVIVSDIPVHRHMIGKDRGLIFKAGDKEGLSVQLAWAMQHTYEMALMADRAYDYVRSHHNWEHITSKYLDLYKSLLLTPQIPSPQIPVQASSKTPMKG